MSNINKTALMYGAGSIGRGFLGQLFGMSGYETCFIDVDETLVSLLNKNKCYDIIIAAETGYKSQTIGNVRAISGKNHEKVVAEIACCDIMATAVGVNILPYIAKTLASGIDKRFEKYGYSSLDIIVCENISDGGTHLKNLVSPHIINKNYFENNIGFVSASVGRMVPASTDGTSSGIIVESYNELPIDATALKTDVSGISNFIPVSPFEIEKYKKYFMHNMSHAITAYLGFIHGYEYIWEAIGDTSIFNIVNNALNEIILAISSYYSIPKDPLTAYADNLLKRYSNKFLKDTVSRVGRDPKRKLSANDRLTGAVIFCQKNGINPQYILYGIAAAFCFYLKDDISSFEVRNAIKADGMEKALHTFTGIKQGTSVFGDIIKLYEKLKSTAEFN